MYFLLGEHSINKTTSLFQIAYEAISETFSLDNPKSEYAFILTSENSSDFKNQALGKYNTVKEEIIDNIHIKILASYSELENFLLSLLLLNEENFPLLMLIDRLNLFIGLQKVNYKEEIYIMKTFDIYMQLFEAIKMVHEKKKVNFILSVDFDLDNLEKIRTDLNNFDSKYMTTILNGIIKYASAIYNITYITDINEMRCFKTLFEFDPGQLSFYKYENSLIYEKENEEVDEIEKKINKSLNIFEKLINEYLKQLIQFEGE